MLIVAMKISRRTEMGPSILQGDARLTDVQCATISSHQWSLLHRSVLCLVLQDILRDSVFVFLFTVEFVNMSCGMPPGFLLRPVSLCWTSALNVGET